MEKKEKGTVKKEDTTKREGPEDLRKKHPFEADSQVQNRYGNGRRKSGSDGTFQDSGENNH